jgi:hypothetical protein
MSMFRTLVVALLGLSACLAVSQRIDPNWARLPAGTEISELRTASSHTYSNGNGTFTAEIVAAPHALPDEHTGHPTNGSDAVFAAPPSSTGSIQRSYYHGSVFFYRHTPELYYGYSGSLVEYVSYAKFDLSAVPESSRIMSSQFRYYQYEYTGSVRTRVTYLGGDPDSMGNEEVFFAVKDGGAISEQSHAYIGWVAQNLNEDGIGLLNQCLSQGWIALGIRPLSGNGSAHGIWGDSMETYLRIVYVAPDENDIQAVYAKLATYPLVADGGPDTAEVVFANIGRAGANGFKVYAIDRGTIYDSATVASLGPGERALLRLRVPTPSASDSLAKYQFAAHSLGDPWQANDTSYLTCWVFPRGTYSAEGFEQPVFPPRNWLGVNNDSAYEYWQWRGDSVISHTGSGCAWCRTEQYLTNDDWLITDAVYPSAGYADTFGFCHANSEYGQRTHLQVWVLRGPNVQDTARRWATIPHTSNAYWPWRHSLDEFDGDTVYIGLRDVSSGFGSALCIDDIWLSRSQIPGMQESEHRTAVTPRLSIEPNPAMGRFAIVRHLGGEGHAGRLALRDVLGRTVRAVDLDASGTTHLDLRGIDIGVYVAQIQSAGAVVEEKVVLLN